MCSVVTASKNMVFAKKFLAERKKLGISAEQLAKQIGVSRSYISLIETGKRLPRKKSLVRVAQALKLKPNIVINWYLEDIRNKLG